MKGFLQSLGINIHNFVKNDPKLENRSLFDAKFCWHEKTFRSQSLNIWGLGIKTSLGIFGLKAFGKGLIKPLVKNPNFNFQKQDLIFKNYGMNQIKLWNLQECLDLGAWGLETTLDQLGPEDVSIHRSRILAPIITNKTSLSQERWDETNKTIKSQKMSWPWGLKPRNCIWSTWDQKTYEAVRFNVQHDKHTM